MIYAPKVQFYQLSRIEADMLANPNDASNESAVKKFLGAKFNVPHENIHLDPEAGMSIIQYA